MKRSRFISLLSLSLCSGLVAVSCTPPSGSPTDSANSGNSTANQPISLTISAAASLQEALTDIQALYAQTHPTITVTYNFGSSGALQQQIEQGAPADVFISAAAKQMDGLQQKDLIVAESRRNLLTNQLVLITPKTGTSVSDFKALTTAAVKRIAIGDPGSVPAGKYGQEVLKSLGLLDQTQGKFVLAKDVRQVLSYVESGNVEAGLVYLTDAKLSDQVRIVATAPASSHAPIVYPIAVLKASRHQAEAQAFAQFLKTDQAQAIFSQYGFEPAH